MTEKEFYLDRQKFWDEKAREASKKAANFGSAAHGKVSSFAMRCYNDWLAMQPRGKN